MRNLLAYATALDHENERSVSLVSGSDVLSEVRCNLAARLRESMGEVTSGELPYVRIPKAHLRLLLQNLIDNALKYRTTIPPRVHVTAGWKAGYQYFSVQDNGIGIEARYYNRIFGLFKRLGSKDASGNGLGLALCKRIVEHHGGQIWVESTLNVGSTFSFTLPSPYPLRVDEETRLTALRALAQLDTPSDPALDEIVRLAASIFNAPMASISLVDENRQWFKARYGLDATENPRDLSFCAHAILEQEPMVVCDATIDARFQENDLVTGPPWIRFYSGAPIRTRAGYAVGTVCVLDTIPREHPSAESLVALANLAAAVAERFENKPLAGSASNSG